MHLNTVLNKLGLVSLLQNKKIDIVTRKFEDIRSNTIYFAFEEITKNFEQIRNKGAYLIIGESSFLNNHYIKVDSIKKSIKNIYYGKINISLWVNASLALQVRPVNLQFQHYFIAF